ncbi:hypothetical protein PROFUN_11105 [Planoprotostelium fungivorum]|uniref:Uncharacterized protein n=1 Tax=Planoprotostelium fungivorum TaxID=1890364 RepID=A0A2P6NAM0_9EUKA|nr:hypothetical protein PROFUN_11105 [Planoprotostelium fungivorum]
MKPRPTRHTRTPGSVLRFCWQGQRKEKLKGAVYLADLSEKCSIRTLFDQWDGDREGKTL